MDGCRRADVHAPGRVSGHQQLRLLEDFPAENEFLQVASREAARRGFGVGCLHAKATDDLFGQVFDLAASNQSVADQALLESAEQGVIRQAQLRHGAMAQALGGDKCQPEPATSVGAQMSDRLPVESDCFALPAGKLRFSAEQRQPFVLTIARHPGDADDFAAADLKVNIPQRAAERVRVVPGQFVDLQKGFVCADLGVVRDQSGRFADHQLRQFPVRAVRRRAMPRYPPAAQHCGAVAQRSHFPELVADKQDAAALARQAAQGHEQFFGFNGREHRGRFVENQQANVLHQAANDLDPLPLANRQAVDQPLRLQRHAVAPGNLADPGFQLRRRTGCRAHCQGNVLRNGEGFEQREMLEHHADSQAAGLGRVAQVDALALPDHLA